MSRSQYSDLFRAIGVQHGAGNGNTTFNLPNRTGRVGVGLDSGQAEFATVAQVGGYKDKTMSHTHSLQNHSHARTAAGPNSDTGGWNTSTGWNDWANPQGWYGETQDHAHQVRTTGMQSPYNSDGLQGWAAGDAHNGVQTTDRTGQNTVAWSGNCPTGVNNGFQDHTHALENHNHAIPGHSHDWAHTHGDSYGTSPTTNTTDSSAVATSGNLQPYVTMTYIVKY